MSQPPPGRYPTRRPWFASIMFVLALLSLVTFVKELTSGHDDSIGWTIAPAALVVICVVLAVRDLRDRRGSAPI